MSSLSAFLSQNALKKKIQKVKVSERFVENGEPILWEVKPITSQEDEDIRKQATKRVPVAGKRGQYTQEVDYNKYIGLLAASCTKFPDLSNKELQDSYGVMGGDQLLKSMLLPGEYADYLGKVQEINGFDKDMEELVDEAKN